jgi:hypothetical protein
VTDGRPFTHIVTMEGMFELPATEANPAEPLPDLTPFLKTFAGVEPGPAIYRVARELVPIWRDVVTNGDNAQPYEEQLTMYAILIDREAAVHVSSVQVWPAAPLTPSSFGEMVAALALRYVTFALRPHDPEHADRAAAVLMKCIKNFDHTVGEVRAGRMRLRAQPAPQPQS